MSIKLFNIYYLNVILFVKVHEKKVKNDISVNRDQKVVTCFEFVIPFQS